MIIANNSAQNKSVWQPKFIEEINQYTCFDCDRFNEIDNSNILKSQSVKQSNSNSQGKIMTIADSKHKVTFDRLAECQLRWQNFLTKQKEK